MIRVRNTGTIIALTLIFVCSSVARSDEGSGWWNPFKSSSSGAKTEQDKFWETKRKAAQSSHKETVDWTWPAPSENEWNWSLPKPKLPSWPAWAGGKKKVSTSSKPSTLSRMTRGTKSWFSKTADMLNPFDSTGSSKPVSSSSSSSSSSWWSTEKEPQKYETVTEFFGGKKPE